MHSLFPPLCPMFSPELNQHLGKTVETDAIFNKKHFLYFRAGNVRNKFGKKYHRSFHEGGL
jgi:hypothetical protein